MCEFQSLYFGEDGYVVFCPKCGHYQLAFASSMLMLTELEFPQFCKMVSHKSVEAEHSGCSKRKSVMLKTHPDGSVHMLLTGNEIKRFNEILEEADNERQALTLISLFNQR